jgi:hypothetical protein
LQTPAAIADFRSLGDARIELSKYPSMSRKHLPAAVLVLIGCSVALSLSDLAH